MCSSIEIKRKIVDFLKLCLSFMVNLVFSIRDVEAVYRCYDAKQALNNFYVRSKWQSQVNVAN